MALAWRGGMPMPVEKSPISVSYRFQRPSEVREHHDSISFVHFYPVTKAVRPLLLVADQQLLF